MSMIDQVKQAMQMRKEATKVQAEIDQISYTHTTMTFSTLSWLICDFILHCSVDSV